MDLKSKDDDEQFLAKTGDDVNLTFIVCRTTYCDVHANLKLALSTV